MALPKRDSGQNLSSSILDLPQLYATKWIRDGIMSMKVHFSGCVRWMDGPKSEESFLVEMQPGLDHNVQRW